LKLRLVNTGLAGSPFTSVAEAVAHHGAVQSQEFAAAKWGLGLRMQDATNSSVDDAFNQGAILRTHILRPTWHFVTPQDIWWMLELTAPCVKARMSPYNRKMELDSALFAKSQRVFARALQKHSYMTRKELKQLLMKAGIETDVQRLAHILMDAELHGLI